MKVQLAQGEDWQGIYVDGELAIQGHTISAYHLLKELAHRGMIEFEELEGNFDEEFFDCFGYHFPDAIDCSLNSVASAARAKVNRGENLLSQKIGSPYIRPPSQSTSLGG